MDVGLAQTGQTNDRSATAPQVTVAPTHITRPGPSTGKRKAALFTLLNLATLGFIVAWLAFDWWAIAYLISH